MLTNQFGSIQAGRVQWCVWLTQFKKNAGWSCAARGGPFPAWESIPGGQSGKQLWTDIQEIEITVCFNIQSRGFFLNCKCRHVWVEAES